MGRRRCCGESVECELCDGGYGSKYVEVTVAGVTGGNCDSCSDFNGTHVLSWVTPPAPPPATCLWVKTIQQWCYGFGDPFLMNLHVRVWLQDNNGLTYGHLWETGGWGAYYGGIDASDCLNWSDLTLTKYSEAPNWCANYPDTITVTAV